MKLAQHQYSRFWQIALLLIIGSLLQGCHRGSFQPPDERPLLPSQVAGASDAGIVSQQAKLAKKGVTVVSMGQNYLVSIPAHLLFHHNAPHLTWESYDILNDVVCYLQQFRKVSIYVSSYASPYRSPQRDRALTLARAKEVSNYLWSQNVDSRFMFTEGHASDKPIFAVRGEGDDSGNARIEITFRRAVA